MTAPNPAHGLGSHMIAIAKQLRERDDEGMMRGEAMQYINQDDAYASMVLIRLAHRQVAREIYDGVFIRGPLWNEAAMHYKWK